MLNNVYWLHMKTKSANILLSLHQHVQVALCDPTLKRLYHINPTIVNNQHSVRNREFCQVNRARTAAYFNSTIPAIQRRLNKKCNYSPQQFKHLYICVANIFSNYNSLLGGLCCTVLPTINSQIYYVTVKSNYVVRIKSFIKGQELIQTNLEKPSKKQNKKYLNFFQKEAGGPPLSLHF